MGPLNLQVPPKLLISSPNVHVSTGIPGLWNWTSRTLNGSSLKRPLWVDPCGEPGETLNNTKSGGHSAGVNRAECHARRGTADERIATVFASNLLRSFWRVHRTKKVFMLVKLRSAMLICAAISAVSMAPAEAGPVPDQVASLESASITKVAIPRICSILRTSLNSPIPSRNRTRTATIPLPARRLAASAPIKASGDLSTMVAQLESSETGSHELDCLATGIYFEVEE